MNLSVADYGVRRLTKVLTDSKRGNPEDIKEALRSDIKRIVSDYAEIEGAVKVEIREKGDEFDILVKVSAKRMKPIGVLPR